MTHNRQNDIVQAIIKLLGDFDRFLLIIGNISTCIKTDNFLNSFTRIEQRKQLIRVNITTK